MARDEFLCHMCELLDMPPGSLGVDARLADLKGWTSLAIMGFIAFADEHFQMTVSPRQFPGCATVRDLAGLVGVQA